jgi:hypothetical protein
VAESLDLSTYTLKRLLNHREGRDVTAGYIVLDVERLRRPMQRITDQLLYTCQVEEGVQDGCRESIQAGRSNNTGKAVRPDE